MENADTMAHRFSRMPILSIIGLATGIATALLIALFRWLIELPQWGLSVAGIADNLSALPNIWRFMLPVAGALLLWAIWSRESTDSRRVGITHLHEHLSYKHRPLPMRNLLNQLIGAAVTLGCGHPVGREGPGVHLGAAISSQLGERVGVGASHQRLLIGCGSAAAIAALFNLPLAGILFAMEVILLEYSITGFVAVIVAAVSADTLTQILFSHASHPELIAEPIKMSQELPLLLLMTLAISLLAFFFQEIQVRTAKHRAPLLQRMLIAGLLVGSVALVFPQVLLPVHLTTLGSIGGSFDQFQMLGLLACYLLLTPVILGLGVPGGVIGPALAAGALIGALLAGVSDQMQIDADVSNYALIGMAAMMSAIIHAPLAALVAVFEWSSSSHILTAAMLVIVGSELMIRSGLKRRSIFERMLSLQGLSRNTQVYRRVMMNASITEVMNRNFALNRPDLDETAQNTLAGQHCWIIRQTDSSFSLSRGWQPITDSTDSGVPKWEFPDDMSSNWVNASTSSDKANLLQVLDIMREKETAILVVLNKGKPVGVISHAAIQDYYARHSD